jgi:hypothetical protein
MADPKIKVVRLTTTEFELSDGRVYQHPVPLEPDELPTLQEFQSYYEYWFTVLSERGNAGEVVNEGGRL